MTETNSLLERHLEGIADYLDPTVIGDSEATHGAPGKLREAAAELRRLSTQPSTEAVKLADEMERLIDRVHTTCSVTDAEMRAYEAFDLYNFAFKHREPILAALRQSPPLPLEDEVERVAKLHAFERRSVHDSARDADHYWENLGAETQTAELKAASATIAALSNMRGTDND